MGKLYKFKKRYLDKLSPSYQSTRALVGKDTMNDIVETTHPLGEQAEAAYDANKAAEKALKEAEAEPVIPMPDEEEIARVKRRRTARRGGGRSSTVLSDSDSLGG